MVDTTKFEPKEDIEWLCKKILLGSIRRDYDNQTTNQAGSQDGHTSPPAQQSPPPGSSPFAQLGRHGSLALRQPMPQPMPPDVYGWQQQAGQSRASTAYPPSWPSGAEYIQGQQMYPSGWQPPAPGTEASQSQQGRQSSTSPPRFELRSQRTLPTTYQH